MVLFVVALATIVVVNLTYSSFLGARLNSATMRNLQAEYLLKSTINFARSLLKEDDTLEDGIQDIWGVFINSQVIPGEMLGVDIPNLHIELEITPENMKMPLRAMLRGGRGSVDDVWRDAVVRLFQSLGFDDDNEKDHTGHFKNRVFNSQELVSVLIDYMDKDNESYGGDTNFPPGVESDLDENTFANARIKRIGELVNVPGFTPTRMRKLSPLATVFDNNRININLAPPIIIEALHEDIGRAEVDAIVAFRKETPFDAVNKNSELSNIITSEVFSDINIMVDVKSSWFQVLAKVVYGSSTYFMRSYLSKSQNGELPTIRSVELF